MTSWLCNICGKCCGTFGGLNRHRAKAHGKRSRQAELAQYSVFAGRLNESPSPTNLHKGITNIHDIYESVTNHSDVDPYDVYGNLISSSTSFHAHSESNGAGNEVDFAIQPSPDEEPKTKGGQPQTQPAPMSSIEQESVRSMSKLNDSLTKRDLFFCKFTKWRYANGVSNLGVDSLFRILHEFEIAPKDFALPKSNKTVLKRVRKFTPQIGTRKGTITVNEWSPTDDEGSNIIRNPQKISIDRFFVETRSLLDLCLQTLAQSELNQKKNLILKPNGKDDDGEICTGEWWKTETAKLADEFPNLDLHVLPLIFYSDGAIVDNFGKRSIKPLMLSLGIFRGHIRRSLKGKMCVGYFPIPEKDMAAEEKLKLYHQFWSYVLHEIESLRVSVKPYIEVPLNGYGNVRLVPSICLFVADHPEAQLLCCHKDSNQTATPCRVCLCPKDNLNCLTEVHTMRLSSAMEEARAQSKHCESLSLQENCVPAFVKMKSLAQPYGVYGSTPPCIMHTFLSQGLVKRLMEGVISILKAKDVPSSVFLRTQKSRLQEFGRRWAQMPDYSNNGVYLRKFKENITDLSRLTATDNLHILMQLRAVLGTDPNVFMPEQQFCGVVMCLDSLHDLIRVIKYQDRWNLKDIQSLKQEIER